jgi:hypothetical protein
MRAGICTPVCKEFTIHFDVDWMKNISLGDGFLGGIVIGRHICFAKPAEDVPEWLLRHELEHARQQIRDGRVFFYLKYFYYSLRYGYKKNPYEVEAYARQHDALTSEEHELLWKSRNG